MRKHPKSIVVDKVVVITDREAHCMKLLYREMTSEEIAKEMFLTRRTVEGYRLSLISKTQSKNVIGVIKFGIKHGIITV